MAFRASDEPKKRGREAAQNHRHAIHRKELKNKHLETFEPAYWGAIRACTVGLTLMLGVVVGAGIVIAEPPTEPGSQPVEDVSSGTALAEAIRTAATAEERQAAAAQLLQLEPGEGSPLAAAALVDAEKPHAREAVISALGEATTVPPELLPALLSGIPNTKAATDEGLSGVLRRYPASLLHAECRRQLNDADRSIEQRRMVMRALVQADGSIGTATIIAELLDHDDTKLTSEAVQQLAQLAAMQFEDVAAAKEWWNANRTLTEAQWLADVAERRLDQLKSAKKRNAELMAKLVDAHREFYLAASEEERAARLVNLLKEPMLELRLLGFDLIDAMVIDQKEVPQPARDELLRRLGDSNKNVRARAATLIGNLRIKQALPVLLDAMVTEESLKCRNAIINALGRLDDPAAITPLLEYVASDPDGSLSAAISALSQLARKGNLESDATQRVVDAIIAAYGHVEDAPIGIHIALLEAMGRVGAAAFRPLLIVATEAKFEEAIRVQAIAALANIDGEPTIERLRALLQDGNQAVRTASITGLGRNANTENDFARLARRSNPEVEANAQVQDTAWVAAKNVFERLSVETQRALTTNYEAHDEVTTRARRIGLIRLLKAQRASMQALSDAQKYQLNIQLAELLVAKNDAAAALTAYQEAANVVDASDTDATTALDAKIVELAFATNQTNEAMQYLSTVQGSDTTALRPRAGAVINNIVPRLIEQLSVAEDIDALNEIEKAAASLRSLASTVEGDIPPLQELDNRITTRRAELINAMLKKAMSDDTVPPTLSNFDPRFVLLQVHQELSMIYAVDASGATTRPATNERVLLAIAKQLKPDWTGYAADASPTDKQTAIDTLITP